MKIIQINTDNTMIEIDININKNIKNVLEKMKVNTNMDKEKIELINCWQYENNIIECYGYLSSENNIINTHKLPNSGTSNILDDGNDIILYNNIYIVGKHENKYIDYYIHDYGNLYYLLNEIDDNEYNDYNESNNYDSDNENDNIETIDNIDTLDNIELSDNIIDKELDYNKELDYDTNNYI